MAKTGEAIFSVEKGRWLSGFSSETPSDQFPFLIIEKRALEDGLSDIGRFSLPESSFEGIRRSRTRGLFEHCVIQGTVLWIAETFGREMDKHAEFRRAEKVDEGMALKI